MSHSFSAALSNSSAAPAYMASSCLLLPNWQALFVDLVHTYTCLYLPTYTYLPITTHLPSYLYLPTYTYLDLPTYTYLSMHIYLYLSTYIYLPIPIYQYLPHHNKKPLRPMLRVRWSILVCVCCKCCCCYIDVYAFNYCLLIYCLGMLQTKYCCEC